VGGLGPGPPVLNPALRTTRHTYKWAALYTAADRRATNHVKARCKLNGKVVRHARHPREDVALIGRVGEDATRKPLP